MRSLHGAMTILIHFKTNKQKTIKSVNYVIFYGKTVLVIGEKPSQY